MVIASVFLSLSFTFMYCIFWEQKCIHAYQESGEQGQLEGIGSLSTTRVQRLELGSSILVQSALTNWANFPASPPQHSYFFWGLQWLFVLPNKLLGCLFLCLWRMAFEIWRKSCWICRMLLVGWPFSQYSFLQFMIIGLHVTFFVTSFLHVLQVSL